jgi:hypothetical protein
MADEFNIVREVLLEATPDEVWESVATAPGQATWFGLVPPIDPSSEIVTAWEPGRRLVLQIPPAPDGSTQAFEYLISARDGATTVLRFMHSGSGGDWAEEFEPTTAAGWDMYLQTLAQYHAHFAGRPATYVEAEAPTSSSTADAWPLFLDVLCGGGASGAARMEVGSPVAFSHPRLPRMEGVVDLLTDQYVGVLTPDDLIRFHGRWSLGMPVAVSHRHYAGGLEPSEAQKAWESWLAGAFAASEGARD